MAGPASLRDQVVVEWILTNGKLPGFEDLVKRSLPEWSKVPEGGRTVYRAQGGLVTRQIEDTEPTSIKADVRSVLATSTSKAAAARYAGTDCCMFEIFLKPGTRIIDVSKIVKGPLSEDDLRAFRERCDSDKVCWPNTNTGTQYIKDALLKRVEGRVILDKLRKGETERTIKEIVPPEEEIMVYAVGGTFSEEKDIDPIEKKAAKSVIFTPPPPPPSGARRSRGRTFRRTSKRRNKNGRRLTRQSKRHVRDRHA